MSKAFPERSCGVQSNERPKINDSWVQGLFCSKSMIGYIYIYILFIDKIKYYLKSQKS